MTETIAVVRPAYMIEEAYQMGHDRFKGMQVEEIEDFDFSMFTGTAVWANNVAPKLRSMAGHDDRGHGTYTENRKIAAIKPGNEEDRPAEAELMEAHHLFEALVDAYQEGALDGVEGTYDPDSAQHHW